MCREENQVDLHRYRRFILKGEGSRGSTRQRDTQREEGGQTEAE